MTGLTLTAEQEAAYDLEVAEVGARAVEWLDNYQMATLYSDLDARIWSQILMMVRSIQARTDGAIPAEWMPTLDERGMWAPSWLSAGRQPGQVPPGHPDAAKPAGWGEHPRDCACGDCP